MSAMGQWVVEKTLWPARRQTLLMNYKSISPKGGG